MACGHNFKTKTWKSDHVMLSKLSGDHRLPLGKKVGDNLWFDRKTLIILHYFGFQGMFAWGLRLKEKHEVHPGVLGGESCRKVCVSIATLSAYFSTSIWEGPSLSCTSEGQLVVWGDISQILQTGLGSALLLQKSS